MTWMDKLQTILEEENRKTEEMRTIYWNNVDKVKLPCANASYVNKAISCSITGACCVCSYFDQIFHGMMMNHNFTNCPGYKEE